MADSLVHDRYQLNDFYLGTMRKLVTDGVLGHEMKVLVICGGDDDRRVMQSCGFSNVTISNIDGGHSVTNEDTYVWSCQDAEDLDYPDAEFDVCVAHSGLHHCSMPHKALIEMYRVSKTGLVVFEPLDNMTSRFSTRVGLGQEFEVSAVAETGCTGGGVRNTAIPNYVYRWTPREIEKTITSFAPIGHHTFLYFYAMRLNWERASLMKSKVLQAFFRIASPVAYLFSKVFPRESNNFAFVVLKPRIPEDLYPWLRVENNLVQLNEIWIEERYRSQRRFIQLETSLFINQSRQY
jgi:SAM-dependent methyltransferase